MVGVTSSEVFLAKASIRSARRFAHAVNTMPFGPTAIVCHDMSIGGVDRRESRGLCRGYVELVAISCCTCGQRTSARRRLRRTDVTSCTMSIEERISNLGDRDHYLSQHPAPVSPLFFLHPVSIAALEMMMMMMMMMMMEAEWSDQPLQVVTLATGY